MNAGWDEKMLASELRELETDGMDLALIGFSDEELEALLEDGDAPSEDVTDDVSEPPAQPVTQPGDVWLIGAHRLICGDCREGDTVRHMTAGKVVSAEKSRIFNLFQRRRHGRGGSAARRCPEVPIWEMTLVTGRFPGRAPILRRSGTGFSSFEPWWLGASCVTSGPTVKARANGAATAPRAPIRCRSPWPRTAPTSRQPGARSENAAELRPSDVATRFVAVFRLFDKTKKAQNTPVSTFEGRRKLTASGFDSR